MGMAWSQVVSEQNQKAGEKELTRLSSRNLDLDFEDYASESWDKGRKEVLPTVWEVLPAVSEMLPAVWGGAPSSLGGAPSSLGEVL